MTISSAGNVGIGTTGPTERLSVVGNICATGTITASQVSCGSDIRWKKDIRPLNSTLQSILKLQGIYYRWKKDAFPERQFNDRRQIGLIAQEVEKIYPELVITDKQGFKYLDYERFTAVLLEAIRELKTEKDIEIEQLKGENGALKATIKQNTKEIAEIKSIIGIKAKK